MKHRLFSLLPLLAMLVAGTFAAAAQTEEGGTNDREAVGSGVKIDYNNPREYVIGDIKVSGNEYQDADRIISYSGLESGMRVTIPSEELSSKLRSMVDRLFFQDIGFYVDSLYAGGDTVSLRINVVERYRVSNWYYHGVKKGEQDDLKEKLNLRRGGALSEYVKTSSVKVIKDYYKEKGFLNVDVDVKTAPDSLVANAVKVTFDVNRGPKVKVQTISYDGVSELAKYKLDKSMKKTKDKSWYNFFHTKKFNEEEYPNDKETLIEAFNELGFRDAKIARDSIYPVEEGRLGIDFKIDQGRKYYFRNISWTGNSVFAAEQLGEILRISKGDVYDLVALNRRLQGGGKEGELSVASLYRDNGYLFFSVTPVETTIVADSVDVEIRLVEGKQATFNNVLISGNNITNERVIRRAVYTRPGYLYSQSDFERSIRELGTMTNFDAEKIVQQGTGWNLMPNQYNNTVDISYNVEEKPNSQLELSGGWGARTFVGTLGINFSNFSTRNFFRKECWRPVPLGDNQNLAIRFQTNGTYYQALSAQFTEPWLTGKKPTSLNISAYFTRQTNSYISNYYAIYNDDRFIEIGGVSVGIGKRLKWPDNYFTLYNSLGAQFYNLQNWYSYYVFTDGRYNNLNYTVSLARTSIDQQIYPRKGSDINLSLQITPPYSLLRKNAKSIDYSTMDDKEHYKWLEYHKWTFTSKNYTKIVGNLVLMTSANFGYLGSYNRKWGYSPFEGFLVGGDGMSGYNTYGNDIICLRGYEDYSLTPYINGAYAGNVYDKFTVELRHPIILQPQSTIFALAFLEGGNCWADIKDFNPFQIKRSAGVGLRIFLSVIGMLGIDWGYGFDAADKSDRSQFHFTIGQQF
ncbi:MAG: BamA/TamA family outer membrane protein [Bacteroidales bacterium]|nr:BamA/TamA family outer membrane protein [Bacteroidales bacterium]